VQEAKRKVRAPIGSHAGKLIVIGSDHKGYRLKRRLKAILRRRGWRVEDVGSYSEKRVDYPVFAERVARRVSRSEGRTTVGIGICATGIGMSVVAAKVPGVLPANIRTVAEARVARTHNNTNFLALAANELTVPRALKIADAWLKEPFFADPERDRNYLKRYIQTIRLDRKKR